MESSYNTNMNDEAYMQIALEEARKAADAGEVLKRWYGDSPRARAALRLLGSEAHAADLWNSVCFEQTGRLLPPLYARPMIVV